MLTTNKLGAIVLGTSALLFLGAAQSPNVCRLSKREAPNKGTTIIARASFDPNQPNKSLIYFAAALGNAGVAALLWGKKEPQQSAIAQSLPGETTEQLPALPESMATPVNQSDDTFYVWSRDLLGYPSVLIYGAQGAGKTSFASWLVGERIKLGHKIRILDPHREYGQWAGLDCVGDGMNYEAIDRELGWFTKEIKRRYQERAISPNYQPSPITVLCDEFTSWADKCENSADFFRESLSDIRKIGLHVIFISHARTLPGLGGAKGLAATRDAGLLELELEATVDPVTKKAVPKLQGKLKYPGAVERETVALAPWMKGQTDFRATSGVVIPFPDPVVEQPPWKSSEVNPSEDYSDSTPSTSDFPSAEKALFLAIRAHLGSGKSRSWVIENVLGFKGRRFAEGKDLLETLLTKYENKSEEG